MAELDARSNPDDVSYSEADLLDAYVAGFQASGEGYNGEYAGWLGDNRHRPAFGILRDALREDFQEWLKARRG